MSEITESVTQKPHKCTSCRNCDVLFSDWRMWNTGSLHWKNHHINKSKLWGPGVMWYNIFVMIHTILYSKICYLSKCHLLSPNCQHLYNICTTSTQRHWRWSNIVQMSYTCFVFTGLDHASLIKIRSTYQWLSAEYGKCLTTRKAMWWSKHV